MWGPAVGGCTVRPPWLSAADRAASALREGDQFPTSHPRAVWIEEKVVASAQQEDGPRPASRPSRVVVEEKVLWPERHRREVPAGGPQEDDPGPTAHPSTVQMEERVVTPDPREGDLFPTSHPRAVWIEEKVVASASPRRCPSSRVPPQQRYDRRRSLVSRTSYFDRLSGGKDSRVGREI